MAQDFGVVISCYKRDYMFAKACCASVRQFLGNVPLCLLVDGDFPVDDMKRTYNVQTLYRSEIKDPFLREKSFGWGLSKMVLFWESPFERFVYLDADIVVWGNILEKMLPKDSEWDFIADYPAAVESSNQSDQVEENVIEEGISHYFFDTKSTLR